MQSNDILIWILVTTSRPKVWLETRGTGASQLAGVQVTRFNKVAEQQTYEVHF